MSILSEIQPGELPSHPAPSSSVFYLCQRCANCCKWPGDVRVSEREISQIAAFLQMSEYDFIQKHTRLRANRQGLALLEKPNGECEWLEGNSCLLQPVKPQQCRDFPNRWNFPGWQKVCHAIPINVSNFGESYGISK